MKKVGVISLLLIFLAIGVGFACGSTETDSTSRVGVGGSVKQFVPGIGNVYWFLRQSPVTERCYEIISMPGVSRESTAMAEIPCEEMEDIVKKRAFEGISR